MSDPAAGGPPPVQPFGQPDETPDAPQESFAARIALAQRAGGFVAPLITVLIAFVMGGLVVLVTTGKNPLETYKAIFDGAGLNWLFPWVTGDERVAAGFNLQQTLIATTTLILVGLAVAFAFRCGLFNIGGQGQYLASAIFAVWLALSLWVSHRWPSTKICTNRTPRSTSRRAIRQRRPYGAVTGLSSP